MRERGRVRRSIEIITARPVWFVGAMFRRMAEMLKDTAFATLVFRSGDTKLRDSVAAAKAAKETKRTRRQELEKQTISQSPLVVGRSLFWMRLPARAVQRLTKETGLLFALIGLVILLFGSLRRTFIVMTVPLYYLLFQSVIHTEFRYTLAIRYFFMILAAIVWAILFTTAAKGLRAALIRFKRTHSTTEA